MDTFREVLTTRNDTWSNASSTPSQRRCVFTMLLLDGFDAEVVWGNQSETVHVDREFDVDVRQAEHRCPEGRLFRLSHWHRPVWGH